MKESLRTLTIAPRGDREIVMVRDFQAPCELVFDAWTKPELVKRWLLGPSGWSMPQCDIDLRVGGAYRFVWRRDSDGTEMAMDGVYREILRPERIVSTERFDDPWYPGEAVNSMILTQENETTTLTQVSLYESRQARDGVLKSNMEHGVAASYDRLDEILASIARR